MNDIVDEVPLRTWQAIAGRWSFAEGVATYVEPDVEGLPYGVALSDAKASDFVLRGVVELSESQECARFLFGYSASQKAGYAIGVGGYERKFVLSEYFHSRGSKLVEGLGRKEDLQAGRPYALEVRVAGNSVRLVVDGIDVIDRTLPHLATGEQIGLEAYGEGRATFRDITVRKVAPTAFVVMQFGDPYDSFWTEVIQPVTKRVGLQAYRADNVFGPGVVLQDIVQGIKSSRVVIAEVTPSNPNVYYELGYAHASGTPTILLAERKEDGARLPFDISGFRCIFYEDAIRGKRKVETELERHLRNILEQNGSRIVVDSG